MTSHADVIGPTPLSLTTPTQSKDSDIANERIRALPTPAQGGNADATSTLEVGIASNGIADDLDGHFPTAKLGRVAALELVGVVALVTLLPISCLALLFLSSPMDFLAFLTFLPAAVAFALSKGSRCAVAPIDLWGRFAFGWLVLLPVLLFIAVPSMLLPQIALQTAIPLDITTNTSFQVISALTAVVCFTAVEFPVMAMATPSKDPFATTEKRRRWIAILVFTTLGLATGEAFYWTLFSRLVMQPEEELVHGVRTLVSFTVILIPSQVLCRYHFALGTAYREAMKPRRRSFRCIVLPFVLRCAFLFLTLAVPPIMGLQWVGLSALVLVPLYIWVVRCDELRLPWSFLNEAGQLNAVFCGVFNDSDAEHQRRSCATV